MVIVGLLFTLLLHAGSVGGIIWYRRAAAAAEQAPPPPSYVVARLIRKGVRKDPKKLPDKIVPQQSTQKATGVDLSADANDAANKPKKKTDAPISDKQKNALDKIDMLAQAQREIEGEGDPNGTPGGTASAGEGDAYMTRIADIWNRTWSLPAVIPQDEARRLFVNVVVRIDKDGNIQYPIEIKRASGNAHFDSSITLAWQQIRQVPAPPADRLASFLAHGLRLKLTWRGMQ
jgi:hypothetical protein